MKEFLDEYEVESFKHTLENIIKMSMYQLNENKMFLFFITKKEYFKEFYSSVDLYDFKNILTFAIKNGSVYKYECEVNEKKDREMFEEKPMCFITEEVPSKILKFIPSNLKTVILIKKDKDIANNITDTIKVNTNAIKVTDATITNNNVVNKTRNTRIETSIYEDGTTYTVTSINNKVINEMICYTNGVIKDITHESNFNLSSLGKAVFHKINHFITN